MSSRIRDSRLLSAAISGFQANRPSNAMKMTNVTNDQKARSFFSSIGTPSSGFSPPSAALPCDGASAAALPFGSSRDMLQPTSKRTDKPQTRRSRHVENLRIELTSSSERSRKPGCIWAQPPEMPPRCR